MAFCTHCGASADGAFCSQCGRPLAQANGPAGSAMNARPDAPPRRRTNPIVWILVAVIGLACVAGAITLAGGLFLVHKAREAGVDADLFRENPGLAIGKLIAAAHPDAEVVSTDAGSGTVTLRDRRTGKEMTLSFDQVRKGFRLEADEDNGRRATVQFGGDAEKVPADVPVYPGAKVQATFEVDGDGAKRQGAYEYEFSTEDAPAKVVAWYHRKLEEDGRKLALHNDTADGGMLVAEDQANRRTLRVIVSRDANGTTINVTARVKK